MHISISNHKCLFDFRAISVGAETINLSLDQRQQLKNNNILIHHNKIKY